MPEQITVGAAQIITVPEDLEANLATHLDAISDARGRGVDLLIFPELSITGYHLSDDSFRLARSRRGHREN